MNIRKFISLFIINIALALMLKDALAWTAGSTGWCTDANGNNYRCSDGPPSSGGQGGGGGNAAAQVQAAADAFNWGLAQGQAMLEAMRQNTLRQAAFYNNKGVALNEEGDIDGSLANYELAAKLNPDDPVIQNNLRKARGRKADRNGLDYAGQQKWDLAIKSFQEAINIDNCSEYREHLEEALNWKELDKPRQKQMQELDKSKEKVSSRLGELAQEFGKTNTAAGPGPELDFISAKESLYSKGDQTTSVVDLRRSSQEKLPVIDPKVTSGKWSKEKFEQLKTDISSEIYPECQDKNLDCAARTELILDAVQTEEGDWEKSVIFLEKEAQKRGGATPVFQQSISYLEGFQYYEKWSLEYYEKLNPPAAKDAVGGAETLLDDLWRESKSGWPGPKRQAPSLIGGQPVMDNPDNWKMDRTKLVYASLEENKSNLNAAIRQLEKKVKNNPKDNTAINALNFFRGWEGFYELAQEYNAKKRK